MEADTLRLILLLIGIALIFGIYLADRLKKKPPTEQSKDWMSSDQEQPMAEHVEPSWDSLYQEKLDAESGNADSDLEQTIETLDNPVIEEQPEDLETVDTTDRFERTEPTLEPDPVPEEKAPENIQMDDRISDELEQLEEILHEGHGHEIGDDDADSDAPMEQMSMSFINREVKKKVDPIPEPDIELPVKIIQLTIVPKEDEFYGDDILCVVSEVGMHLGEMNIFHRYADEASPDGTMFSMASMLEPGTFPADDMDNFKTPGLTIFASLPGPKDGLSTFSEMLYTAEKLTELLDGELRDETHSALSKQTISHIREEIQEHHRQVQLARSKQ